MTGTPEIEHLDLYANGRVTLRAYYVLRRMGIETIEQIKNTSDQEFLAQPNVGQETLRTIRQAVEKFDQGHRREFVFQCEVDGCEDVKSARGLCEYHYKRWQRTGIVGDGPDRRYGKRQPATCRGPECERDTAAKGLCITHLRQSRRGYELTPIRAYRKKA
ncbi:hypothetical protein SEA_MARLEY1013_51 [Mycobacterium phage Marley1013]|nr:hypothetical protein SEA_MORTY007_51 [Mycobacterium phage Morty007]AZF93852.1 hypothetical protein SEA_MARLEY1013_51 [Mycobacterium phage Marley1013]